MLNEFGKALRKIRIDRQELLKDMADVLNVSSAYLSAVENGKRSIPEKWIDIIAKRYSLSESEQKELRRAADESKTDVTISLKEASKVKRNAVLTFAQALDGLSDEELTQIMSNMKKGNKKNYGHRA